MALTEPTRDRTRCCTRCTRRPHLEGCLDWGCNCHAGANLPPTKPLPVPLHKCLKEDCKECAP